MTLQSSGNPISFSQIRTEFGDGTNTGTSPVRLGKYRRDDGDFGNKNNGSLTNMPLDTGVPTSVSAGSSSIAASNFFSKKLNVVVNYHTSDENRPEDAKSRYNTTSDSTGTSTGKWNVVGGYKNPPSDTSGTKVMINVNKEIGSVRSSASSDKNKVALRTGSSWTAGTTLQIDIGSSGRIQGAGGSGGSGGGTGGDTPDTGNTGTSGLGVEYAAQINNSGIIRCGYGGGGGGTGGASNPNKSTTDFGATGGGGGGGAGIPFGLGSNGGGAGFNGGNEGGDGDNGTKDAGGNGGSAAADVGGASGGAGGNGADHVDTAATQGGTGSGGGPGYDGSDAGSGGGANGFGIIFSNSTIQSNSTGNVTLDAANGGVSNSAGVA